VGGSAQQTSIADNDLGGAWVIYSTNKIKDLKLQIAVP
jgi:hypothetical protein